MDGSERLPWTAKARMRACEHRAVTKGAAEATESGAHHDAAQPKQSRLEPDSMFQRLTVPAAMAVASSGACSGKDSPTQWQLKKKGSLLEWNPRPPSSEAMDGRLEHG